jgi:hypothetical protein
MAANEAITRGNPIMPSTPQQTPHAAIGGKPHYLINFVDERKIPAAHIQNACIEILDLRNCLPPKIAARGTRLVAPSGGDFAQRLDHIIHD